jgi:translation initiation factor IF-3
MHEACRVQVKTVWHERVLHIDRNQSRINDQIRLTPIRLIDAEGEQCGIVETEDALKKAEEDGLDLVEIAPNERPPVCRIMDYGKYKYDRKKKNTQSTHASKTKEIRLRPKTGQHDIDFKVRKARDFLEHKDKVQVSVIFRGREMAHIEEGRKVMDRVIEQLAEIGKIEQEPSRMGRRMTCLIVPR